MASVFNRLRQPSFFNHLLLAEKKGQAACKKASKEIAADCLSYLNSKTGYDKIIAFIWDDCAQAEESKSQRVPCKAF